MVIEEMEYKTMNMEDYNNLKIHFSDNYTEFDEIDFFYE